MGSSNKLVGGPITSTGANLLALNSWLFLFYLLLLDLFLSHQEVSIDHATRHPFAAFRSPCAADLGTHMKRLPQKIEFGSTRRPRNRPIVALFHFNMHRPLFSEDQREDRLSAGNIYRPLSDCLLFLLGYKSNTVFIHCHHVGDQFSCNGEGCSILVSFFQFLFTEGC